MGVLFSLSFCSVAWYELLYFGMYLLLSSGTKFGGFGSMGLNR